MRTVPSSTRKRRAGSHGAQLHRGPVAKSGERAAAPHTSACSSHHQSRTDTVFPRRLLPAGRPGDKLGAGRPSFPDCARIMDPAFPRSRGPTRTRPSRSSRRNPPSVTARVGRCHLGRQWAGHTDRARVASVAWRSTFSACCVSWRWSARNARARLGTEWTPSRKLVARAASSRDAAMWRSCIRLPTLVNRDDGNRAGDHPERGLPAL